MSENSNRTTDAAWWSMELKQLFVTSGNPEKGYFRIYIKGIGKIGKLVREVNVCALWEQRQKGNLKINNLTGKDMT